MPRSAPEEKILIIDRQRQTPPKRSELDELKSSIRAHGLLHPPVVMRHSDGFRLISGFRRLTVMRELIAEGVQILHDTFLAPKGAVPITLMDKPSDLEVAEAELEENLMREDLSWQDQDRALAAIHTLRETMDPKQTVTKTAAELAAKGATVGKTKTKEALRVRITKAKVVAPFLADPEISGSRNTNEAYTKIVKRSEREALAKLHAKATEQDKSMDLRLGDCKVIIPTLEPNSFDLILTDPPYGIGAHTAGFRNKSPHTHDYDDTFKAARELLQFLLIESFRVAKGRANLFLFTDIAHWTFLQEAAQRAGWVPFRTPIVWVKSTAEGRVPWGASGPLRTNEMIFYATKGQRGLYYSIPDTLIVRNVSRKSKVFAAQKPHNLLRQLISVATLPGETVFDPCAGSGSTLRTSRILGRKSVGLEVNPTTYSEALGFIHTDLEEDETVLTVKEMAAGDAA